MRFLFAALLFTAAASSQTPRNPVATAPVLPPIEPGVSLELAKWRAAHYSDVRYKLNLTLEKMSPVLKGTIEIKVNVKNSRPYARSEVAEGRGGSPIVLDWRKIKGYEHKSTISDLSINGQAARLENHPPAEAGPLLGKEGSFVVHEVNEHLVFRDGVVVGENVIKLDFTSPILTSGSAITRYVDKEDGSEYIYSLFVPSDASTAFPVFDQPDLKARFTLTVLEPPAHWKIVSNTEGSCLNVEPYNSVCSFSETKPISTYVFSFAAGPWEKVSEPPAVAGGLTRPNSNSRGQNSAGPKSGIQPPATAGGSDIYVRKSQAAKFQPHAAEVFRLNREAVKYFEQYFDYKFPFPKYDLVLIPEFPFGGMEHAGATFLREPSVIFPQEPTKNDHISRATLIFHEAAHQWFGDTVTMRWFDDLWLKEGFATFTAYKAMETIMPEMNAWKVFYERIKQGAYQTDSTKGTTAIYQPIANLSAAKSAYGNIVYNKAPAFLRQAEFSLGEDKFQTAVRAFLKKHEYANAGFEDLVGEFVIARKPRPDGLDPEKVMIGDRTDDLRSWAKQWVTVPGVPLIRTQPLGSSGTCYSYHFLQTTPDGGPGEWREKFLPLIRFADGQYVSDRRFLLLEKGSGEGSCDGMENPVPIFLMPNYGDYGYGIFLLDDKSREYVLKNIQNEKDPFLRSMMWGAVWDSVREGELDPREFVELAIKNLPTETDESMVASILGRTGTAMNYYLSEPPAVAGGLPAQMSRVAGTGSTPSLQPPATADGRDLQTGLENVLIERMQNAATTGQRITFYRALLNISSSENARNVLKGMLKSVPGAVATGESHRTTTPAAKPATPPKQGGEPENGMPLKAKDKFDIVTRLLILNDPEAPKLLADLEKTETSDDAKRYAYAARAGLPTAENKAKYWNDFVNNKEISESWIEAAFVPWNSIRHSELTLPYLLKALQALPNHKRNRKIFFVNGWLGAFIGGQRSEEALAIVNKFLADDPKLDNDLRLKILENVDLIERAVKIRNKYKD